MGKFVSEIVHHDLSNDWKKIRKENRIERTEKKVGAETGERRGRERESERERDRERERERERVRERERERRKRKKRKRKTGKGKEKRGERAADITR